MKSEFELIETFTRRIGRGRARGVVVGVGDDAAVLRFSAREDVVVTADAMVEGVHFERRWLDGATLGARLAAINLSDIAAMGGQPRFALLSLAVPRNTPTRLVEAIEQGAIRSLARHGARAVGGNLTATRGPLVCDMTLLGTCARGRAWQRAARAGDAIIVAGRLGAAAVGVHMLRAGKKRGAPVNAYRRPVPRLDVVRALGATRMIHGAIDISDGLSSDIIHMCEAGDVGCDIDARALPIAPAVRSFCAARGTDPVTWSLHAGEDYALIVSVAPRNAAAACRAMGRAGAPAVVVGRFTRHPGMYRIVDATGVRAFGRGGWDHLRRSRR
ncbi:MAG TPA: thiamine-phosphate kinase [Candidatus Krumholzibacteria bacterium]|nr:thiamine-phosphate kinase [Candidatus Krumholzibacteria bacterium]